MDEVSGAAVTERERDEVEMPRGGKKVAYAVLLCVIGIALNFAVSQIVVALGLPLYLDSIGTMLAAAFGAYIPGVIVGYITNFLTSAGDPSSFYYCLTSVLIAVFAAFATRRGWFEKPLTIVAAIVVFSLIGGGVGSVITCCLYGPLGGGISTPLGIQLQMSLGLGDIAAQMTADFLIDLVDKTISVLVLVLVLRVVPANVRAQFDFGIWQQRPLTPDQQAAIRHVEPRAASLRTKFIIAIVAAMAVVAVVTIGISYNMFHHSNVEAKGQMGQGIASLVAEKVDGDRVDEYLAQGESAEGYAQTEQDLAAIRDSFPEVQYVYVYQIDEDGCHVVFDPDTDEEEGSDVGDVVEFDADFLPYLDDLLAGEPIDPIVSNGAYGWLLTVYQPLHDSSGDTVCYVAVDISMDNLLADDFTFLTRVIMLFLAFLLLICVVVIWFAEYGIVTPINSIAYVSRGFAFDDEATRESNVERLRGLDVHTGDEVENLYLAVLKTSEDTMQFIADAQEKAATIERMQDNLIMVMADLVESRDKHTGDHVRKTAAYCDIILKQMREEGIYADELSDEFMTNVVKSAPLHDIGKISVSDVILNKPGRLTDEEFEQMKGHTLAGRTILEDAVGAMSDPGYLDEAQRLAAFHHEKWNGKGYPYGLAGKDIPLSARIMAVADVFDALVSERSYKKGMPIDKALQIIRDDAGSHFDPLVAEAFLRAEPEVRRVAEQHGDAHGTAGDIRDE